MVSKHKALEWNECQKSEHVYWEKEDNMFYGVYFDFLLCMKYHCIALFGQER